VPACFASRISCAALSRTCDTLPGADASSGKYIVWIESTTMTEGFSSSTRRSTVVMSFSESTYMPVSEAPSRFARSRTCRADSSPDTYSTRPPARAMFASACVSSVDFPMPGSPPTSTTEPSTTPPPSTRSSSPMPEGLRSAASSGISSILTASAPAPGARFSFFSGGFPSGERTSSTSVFQFSHSGHRPSHRPVS